VRQCYSSGLDNKPVVGRWTEGLTKCMGNMLKLSSVLVLLGLGDGSNSIVPTPSHLCQDVELGGKASLTPLDLLLLVDVQLGLLLVC